MGPLIGVGFDTDIIFLFAVVFGLIGVIGWLLWKTAKYYEAEK